MATVSAYPFNLRPEDVLRSDGDEDVWGEEKDEVVYSDDDSIPDEVFYEYHKQVGESEGFEVDDFSNYPMFGSIRPLQLIDSCTREVIPYTELAIKYFNEKEDANIEFVKILKVNSGGGCGINYYITFEAKDAADGQTKSFQAQVLCGIKEDEVILCRLKRPPTKQVVCCP